LHAIIPPFIELQEATTTRNDAENRLRKLQAHPQDHGFNLPPGDARVLEAEKHLTKVSDNLRRLQERSEMRGQAWRAASQALANVESWLRHGKPSGVLLQEHETEVPKLAKNEPGLLDAIENRRRRVRELRADLHRIASSPYPSSYAKQRPDRGIGDARCAIGVIVDRA
jgi:hypothetical protein